MPSKRDRCPRRAVRCRASRVAARRGACDAPATQPRSPLPATMRRAARCVVLLHAGLLSSWCRRRSRDRSRGRRSGGRACRRRPRRLALLDARARRRSGRRAIAVVALGRAARPSRSSPTSCASSRTSSVTACARLDREVHHDLGAERLASARPCRADRRSAGASVDERRVLEILGPDAEDRPAARVGRERRACVRASRRRARATARRAFAT